MRRLGDSMATQLDDEGNQIKQLVIVEASSRLQMEQLILEFMMEGYELHGGLAISPKGVFAQMMIAGKKVQRIVG